MVLRGLREEAARRRMRTERRSATSSNMDIILHCLRRMEELEA
jgi:hypothetical protein